MDYSLKARKIAGPEGRFTPAQDPFALNIE
jgi:hypothetical protein